MDTETAAGDDPSSLPPDDAEMAFLKQAEHDVSAALRAVTENFLDHASISPSIVDAVLRVIHERNASEIYENQIRMQKCLSTIIDLSFAGKFNAVYKAFETIYDTLDLIWGRLRNYQDYDKVDKAEVSAAIALVATLPRARRHPPSIREGVTPLHSIGAPGEPYGDLVSNLLNRGSFCVIYGPPGCGKSWLAIDLAMAVATGRPWRDRATRKSGVVFVAAEGSEELQTRAHAWREHHGVDDAPLVVISKAYDLTKKSAADALLDDIWHAQVHNMRRTGLIIIDTFSACFVGDENSGSDTKAFIANVKRIRAETDACVIALHHSAKSGGMRGHGSLPADAEAVICVAKGIAKSEKMRGAPDGEAFPFRVRSIKIGDDARGMAIISGVVEHLTDAPAAAPKVKPGSPDPLPLLADAVRRAADAGSPFKLHQAAGVYQRRAELPPPLSGMGRNALVALAKAGIETGALVSSGGTLTAPVSH